MSEFSDFRKKLAVFDDGLFLNYAATAPLSRTVIESMKAEIEEMKHPLGQRFYQTLNKLEFARREFAELIHAKGSEIAFTQNTSMAVSTVAAAVSFAPGDVVYVPDNEFPSNYYPWENLKNKGVICRKFSPKKNIPIVETLAGLDLKNVKLISLSAVSYQTGRLYELKAFADFCRSQKIYSCLDSIQAIGAVPFDVKQIGVDFVCSGAQKWILGPVGCGMIYAREELLESLHVPFVGWTSVLYPEYYDLGGIEFSKEMTRFEPGLPNYISLLGMSQSLTELKQIGWPQIHSSIASHTKYLDQNIQNLGFELLCGDHDLRAGITSFYFPKEWDHRRVEEAYHKEKVKVTARDKYVRVSPHFFNEKSELDQFLNITESLFKKSKLKQPAPLEVPKSKEVQKSPGRILVLGATGNLGQAIVRELGKLKYPLHLLGTNQAELTKLKQELGENVLVDQVDFSNADQVQGLISRLQSEGKKKYTGLINAAGIVETLLFEETTPAQIQKMFQVNLEVPTQLMHLFLSELRTDQALGILNIVSSTGRCGNPLMSVYSSTHGALWALGESLSREWSDRGVSITTFVAPAMHSPMQKRMGRIALRFFKMSGSFDYDVPENVSREALQAFFARKSLHISKLSRVKIFTNTLWPELIDQKIKNVWRKNS